MNNLFYNDLETLKSDELQNDAYNSVSNTAVIAGPGSGKTRVLTLKFVSIASDEIQKPSGVACISYSRETVRELRKRIKSYGYIPTNKDFIGTVHSFSLLHVIQPFGGLYPQYNLSFPIRILPRDISNEFYEKTLEKLGIEDKWSVPLARINRHRSLSLGGRSTVVLESDLTISKAAEIYEGLIRESEYIDFTDIINISAKIISEQEYVRDTLQCQFPWLLVDEYQDLGKALHEMVLELAFNAQIKLFAVGDMNQSIYGFNGGYPQFLEELTEKDDVKTVSLSGNYRSSQHIIEASLEALQPLPPKPKYVSEKLKEEVADFTFITCKSEMGQQYKVVAEKVIPKLISKGVPLNEIAIIMSSNLQIREMGTILKDRGINFFVVKWQFENSNVMVWLQDCAGWCIDSGSYVFDDLFHFWIELLRTHDDDRQHWEKIHLKTLFFTVLNDSKKYNTILDWVKYVIGELDLASTLKDSESFPSEVDNLNDLISECKQGNLQNNKLRRFAKLGSPENEVTITTRHSSKGLEFEAVILLGMEDGNFPNYRSFYSASLLAEEQRLCYVCISRAKKICVLLRSEKITTNTRHGPWTKDYPPSRYWVSLHKLFGNDGNTFDHSNYK